MQSFTGFLQRRKMSLMQSPPTQIMTPSINTTKRSIVAASKPPIGSTIISNPSTTTSMMKAIRCQFFVNGDRHFTGIPFVINQDRLRTLDSLCSELSRILINVKTLPSGVRIIFNGHDGIKIDSIKQFRQNGYYVCSSSEHFIRLDYLFIRHNHNNNNNNHNSHNLMPNFSDDVSTINEEKVSDDHDHHHHSLSLQNSTINTTKKPRHCLQPNEPKLKQSTCHKKRMMIGEEKNNNHNLNSLNPTNSMTSSSSSTQTFMSNVANVSDSLNNCLLSVGGVCILKPKLIALLRGSCRAEPQLRPSRRVFRFLLNHRIAQNYEQFLNEISKCVKLNVGAVHKVFALYSSKKITCLNDLNDDECVYLVYGRSEKCSINDFLLDEYEQREICSIVGHSYLDSYFDGKPLNNNNNSNGSRILNRNLLKNNQNHNGNSNRKVVRYCDEIDIYNDDNNNNNHKDNQGRKFKFYLRNSHQSSRKNGHFGGTLMAKSNGHINENRFVTETYHGHEDNDEGDADEDGYGYDDESNLRAYSLPRNFNCKEDGFYETEAGGTKAVILNDIYHNDDGKHKNESKENDTNRDGDVAALIQNDDDDDDEYEYGDGDHYFHSMGQTCSLRDDPGRPFNINKPSLQRRINQNNHHHHNRKSQNLNVHSCSASSLSSDNPSSSTSSLLLSDSRKTIKYGSTPKILAPSDNHDQIRQQRSNNIKISKDQNWQNSSSNSSLVLMDNVADSNYNTDVGIGALTNTPLTFSTISSEDQSPPVSRSNFVVQAGCGSSTPGGASSISCSDDFSFTTFANRNVENNNNDDDDDDNDNIELVSSDDSSTDSVSSNPMNVVSKPKSEQSVCREQLPSEGLMIRNPKPIVESLDEDLSQKNVMHMQNDKPSFIDSRGMKAINKVEPTSTNCNIDKKNGEKKSLKPIKNCWTIYHNRNLRNTVSSANNCSKSSISVTNRKRFPISANKSAANQMEPSLKQLKPPNQILELKKRPTSASPPPPPPPLPPLPPPTSSSPIPQRSSPMVRADQPRPVLNQIPAATRFVPKKEVNDVYFVDKSIGDGKFGVVYTCIHRETRQSYALKVVNKFTMRQVLSEQPQNQRSNNNNSSNQCDEANSEVSILKLVKHPNIVQLYEHFDYVDQCYLVLELLQGGDLFDAISVATKYSEPESASMITDLLNALDYLHRLNIVHRDIKLENLLVSFVPISDSNINTGNGPKMASMHPAPKQYKRMIKLADFGLAVQIKSDEKLYTVCGTPTYVAPEILLEIGYSFPVDIWAAGVILYILLSGLPPFVNEENDQLRLFDQIISGRFEFYGQQWRQISSHAKQIIQSMLCIDQHKRITALQLLEHDWIVHFK